MRPHFAALSLLSAALSGCGPNFSGQHFAVVQGTGGANAPLATAAPAELRPAAVIRPDVRPLPSGLSALTAAYRQSLLESAHPFPPDLAQHFADVEVQSLQQHYAGRDAELEQELIRRLSRPAVQQTTPAPGRPLPRNAYPPDEQSSLAVGSAP